MMSLAVEEPDAARPADRQTAVRYDASQNSYALAIPDDPRDGTIPISYCPWCAAKLRRVRARGLSHMSPEACRKARNALSMTHRQLADAIGESVATVFGYEMGKPTDDAVAGKLLRLFQDMPIAADRSGRIGPYQP